MGKINNIGDQCTKCDNEVVERSSKKKARRDGQRYYYTHYLYCPNCKTIYFHKKYRVMLEEDQERITPNMYKVITPNYNTEDAIILLEQRVDILEDKVQELIRQQLKEVNK